MDTLKPRVPTLAKAVTATATPRTLRGRALLAKRAQIWVRGSCLCNACKRPTMLEDCELDHIAPLHQGGKDNDANLQMLCIPCHAIKTADENRGRSERSGAGLPDTDRKSVV